MSQEETRRRIIMAHVSNMYLRRKGDDDSSLVLSHSDHWSEDLILRDFLFDEAGTGTI